MIVNVGFLGHVDSGKTSLCKALSVISSTAAFDKNPQSKERGITLDLGFSALTLDDGNIVFAFVDCPGHQSLIRTVIGASQIIDLVILVMDVQKGFETQTAECLILGEITRKPMIVVLNKIDNIDEPKREACIEKMTKKIQKTLETTIFKEAKIIPVSATAHINIDKLTNSMLDQIAELSFVRNIDAPFVFAFDHCFSIKGSGSVLSGTILQGTIKTNDTIEIPQLNTDRKIKSMQMFRKAVSTGNAGDRLGICITNFDHKQLERGLICQKNSVQPAFAVIVKLDRIRYYKRDIKTKSKFHCSIGHETVMGNILLFSSTEISSFCWESSFKYEEVFQEELGTTKHYFALIEFEHAVMIYDDILLVGSKLDSEQKHICRLAFHGKIQIVNSSSDRNYQQTFLSNLKVYKDKSKEGAVQRVVNEYEIIASNLFKKETDRSKFIGLKCRLEPGNFPTGTIAGLFGQSSKVRIQFNSPLQPLEIENLKNPKSEVKVVLSFKKFIFDKTHRMIQ